MNKYLIFESNEESLKQIPFGQKKLYKVAEKRVCVIRHDSRLIAIENECPHMNEPLHTGLITHFGEIVCPLHEYRFSLATGAESSERCPSLKFVALSYENGKWYLEF